MEAADTNNLEIKTINLVEGVMIAYSPAHGIPVIVSLSKTNGLKIWYLYEGNCDSCHLETSCRNILEAEAKERGIQLHSIDSWISPTMLADEIFGRYQDD